MTSAIIVHGKPTRERYENPLEPKPHVANWLPWLGMKLEEAGIPTSIPAMPLPYFPVYDDWRRVFESIPPTPNRLLIGHSAGAEFLLRWLSENKEERADKLVLVAPYKDEANKYDGFSRYELDPGIAERIGEIVIFNSLDDDPPIQRRTNELIGVFPLAKYVEFKDYGHFRIGHNMVGPEFPELLGAVLHR